MPNELQRQIARNESSFRAVNEAIEKGRWPGQEHEPVTFRCECGFVGCARLIELTLAEYEAVRANPRRFAIAREHELELAETVVEEFDGYVVVEKRGEAGRVAEANDPRG